MTILLILQIDCYEVDGMTDSELSRYIPRLGDRIAVRQYCKIEVQDTGEVSKAAQSLLTKLKGRRVASKKLSGNSNAAKIERSFQLGMFEKVGESYVQVRERRGGGTRHLKAPKSITMAEVMEMGKQLFFPNGESKIGNVEEFNFTVRDFTEELLDPSTTLGDHYELRKVKILRLYITIDRETDKTTKDDDESLESDNSLFSHEVNFSSTPGRTVEGLEMAREAPHTPPLLTDEAAQLYEIQTSQASIDETPPLLSYEAVQSDGQTSQISIDEEIQVGYVLLDDDSYLDDTLPIDIESLMAGPQTIPQPPRITRIKLHRGNVFQDLNAAFHEGIVSVDDTLLEIEMVLPNGSTEKGEDNGGVLRDALSEYWDTFMTKCTTGSTIKIPMTRHDMRDIWVDVAKVMVLGYNIAGYFPVALAKPFLKHCLGQEVKWEDLWETFLQSIPNEEKKIVEQAMQDFSSVAGSEDWLDFLDAHDVKILVNEANCKNTLLEVAHKEIIQDPAYISKCWNGELKKLRLPPGGLEEVLCNLCPSSKKVIAALQPDGNLSKREQAIVDFLKKYIRNCSDNRLKQFLRFCTGKMFTFTMCYSLVEIVDCGLWTF